MRFLLLLSSVMLAGCGSCQRIYTSLSGEVTFKCVEGVKYIQSDSGLTLLVNKQGLPVECT